MEYRTQDVAQDKEGNYMVSILRKRRFGDEESNETLFSGVTMFTRAGDEVKSLGIDLPYTLFGVTHGFGAMGEAQGYFLYADSIAFDSQDQLWVADVDAKTLQVFARTGPNGFSKLPMVYAPMPADMYPCHMQTLPGRTNAVLECESDRGCLYRKWLHQNGNYCFPRRHGGGSESLREPSVHY